MRKIIEFVSTLALWVLWLVGSVLALLELFGNGNNADDLMVLVQQIGVTPIFALVIFLGMMIVVKFGRKPQTLTKISLQENHDTKWNQQALQLAQSGRIIDLFFKNSGLACEVLARETVATVLHRDLTVKPQMVHRIDSKKIKVGWKILEIRSFAAAMMIIFCILPVQSFSTKYYRQPSSQFVRNLDRSEYFKKFAQGKNIGSRAIKVKNKINPRS